MSEHEPSTGPEHYAYAQRLINNMDAFDVTDPDNIAYDRTVAEAHVHATLALVVATLHAAGTQLSETADLAWGGVCEA